MRKYFFALLISFVISSALLAQAAAPLDPANQTSVLLQAPIGHLEATYNITSAKSKPMGTLTWIADLLNKPTDSAPYSYKVTVTLQNETDKVFGTWGLSMIFLGSVTNVSPEVTVRSGMFSNGPSPGYIILGGVMEQGTLDLSSHGSITFSYIYQLPTSQQRVEAPVRMMLSRGITYVMNPMAVAPTPFADNSTKL